MKSGLSEEGLYYYPGREADREQTEAEDAVWMTKYRMGPTGLLLYRPNGAEPMSPAQLGIQLATDIFGALLLAYLLVAIAGSTGAQVPMAKMLRISFVAGIFAWASISIAHWNWYGFPLRLHPRRADRPDRRLDARRMDHGAPLAARRTARHPPGRAPLGELAQPATGPAADLAVLRARSRP